MFAKFVIEEAGLKFVPDKHQIWTVGETTLAVSVWEDPSGRYVLRIRDRWYPKRARAPRESLCLPELYAIVVAQDASQVPGGQELPRWRWRALVDAGLLPPAPVWLPTLPAEAPDHARATYRLIGSLLEIRWIGDPPDEPFAFSASFAARWAGARSGVDEKTVRNGKGWLEKQGFLRRVGEAPGRPNRPTVLWTVPRAALSEMNSNDSGGR